MMDPGWRWWRIPALSWLGLIAANPGPDTRSAEEPTITRLAGGDLLVFHGPDGAAKPVRSGDDWLRRKSEILQGFRSVVGPLPGPKKRWRLEPITEGEVDCGSYLRRSITYASEPGSRVPAYLLIPKAALVNGARRFPAGLCLHPTDNAIGNGVVVGLGGKPNRAYAAELADRGYVTLAPNYPLLAKYQPDLKALGWESGTLKAVWDNIRGLDLLESLPFVIPAASPRSATRWAGTTRSSPPSLDDRIKVVVSSCGFNSFADYYGGADRVWQPGQGWTQTPLHAPAGRLSRAARRHPVRLRRADRQPGPGMS